MAASFPSVDIVCLPSLQLFKDCQEYPIMNQMENTLFSLCLNHPNLAGLSSFQYIIYSVALEGWDKKIKGLVP